MTPGDRTGITGEVMLETKEMTGEIEDGTGATGEMVAETKEMTGEIENGTGTTGEMKGATKEMTGKIEGGTGTTGEMKGATKEMTKEIEGGTGTTGEMMTETKTEETEDETGTDRTMVRDSDQTGIEIEEIEEVKKVTKNMTGVEEDVTRRERIGIDVVLVIGMILIAKTDEMRDRVGRMIRGHRTKEAVLGDLWTRNVRRPKKTGRRV